MLNIPTDLLRTLITVVDLRSFTKAAAVLSIAQSALSHQVRQLELELDQTLLYRNGRGVMPTDAGRRLLAKAETTAWAREYPHDSCFAGYGNVEQYKTEI